MTTKHWLAHRLGWNGGHVETKSVGDHVLVWFRCDGCGKVSDIHKAPGWIANA